MVDRSSHGLSFNFVQMFANKRIFMCLVYLSRHTVTCCKSLVLALLTMCVDVRRGASNSCHLLKFNSASLITNALAEYLCCCFFTECVWNRNRSTAVDIALQQSNHRWMYDLMSVPAADLPRCLSPIVTRLACQLNLRPPTMGCTAAAATAGDHLIDRCVWRRRLYNGSIVACGPSVAGLLYWTHACGRMHSRENWLLWIVGQKGYHRSEMFRDCETRRPEVEEWWRNFWGIQRTSLRGKCATETEQ